MSILSIVLLLWKIRIQFLCTPSPACVLPTSLSLFPSLPHSHLHTHTHTFLNPHNLITQQFQGKHLSVITLFWLCIYYSHVNHMGYMSPFPFFYTVFFFLTLVVVSYFCLLNFLSAYHYIFLKLSNRHVTFLLIQTNISTIFSACRLPPPPPWSFLQQQCF